MMKLVSWPVHLITMAKELRKTVAEIDEQRNRLEIILMDMTDGVMAFDERGQLIHVNYSSLWYAGNLMIWIFLLSGFWKKLGLKLKDIKQDSIYEMTVNEKWKIYFHFNYFILSKTRL